MRRKAKVIIGRKKYMKEEKKRAGRRRTVDVRRCWWKSKNDSNTSPTMKCSKNYATTTTATGEHKHNLATMCMTCAPWKRCYGYTYSHTLYTQCHSIPSTIPRIPSHGKAKKSDVRLCAWNTASDRRKLRWRGDKDCFELNYEYNRMRCAESERQRVLYFSAKQADRRKKRK